MRVQECASLALQGKVLHVSSCIAFLTALGPARAPGQLESSRSASSRRAARSGECRAYPVVFGLPCPFAFNAHAGCARLCCARAHYLCAQVGVLASPGPPGSWNLPTRPRCDGRCGAHVADDLTVSLVPLSSTRPHGNSRFLISPVRFLKVYGGLYHTILK